MEIAEENYWVEKSLHLLEQLEADDLLLVGDAQKLSETESKDIAERINTYNYIIEEFRTANAADIDEYESDSEKYQLYDPESEEDDE